MLLLSVYKWLKMGSTGFGDVNYTNQYKIGYTNRVMMPDEAWIKFEPVIMPLL